jgi:hypothetical protein
LQQWLHLQKMLSLLRMYPLGFGGAVLAAALRLVPHPPNFTPTGTLCLYAAARLPSKLAAVITALALVISDVVIGIMQMQAPWNTQHKFYGFGLFTLFAYVSYAICGLVAHKTLKHSESTLKQVSVAAVCSTIFFIITNFGSWLELGIYPMNTEGLIAAYAAGLPFYGWHVLGDVFLSTIWFSVHKLLTRLERFSGEKVISDDSYGETLSLIRDAPINADNSA